LCVASATIGDHNPVAGAAASRIDSLAALEELGVFGVAAHDPRRDAVVDPSGAVVDYGTLVGSMRAEARGLAALGLSAGDTVAVVLPNCRELLEVYGAAVETGLTFVALNWHLGADEVAYILEDSGARALVVHERFASAGLEAAEQAGIPADARFAVGGAAGDFRPFAELGAGQPTDAPAEPSAGRILFYTSGTTGRPKGVSKRSNFTDDGIALVSGIGLSASFTGVIDPAEDRVDLVSGPLYHAAPFASACGVLDSGGLLVLMERFDAAAFLDRVERHRVTNVMMVPTMFHRLLELPDDVRAATDVSSLRSVSHAGAPCPVDVKHRMIEWWGPVINEAYSSTEGAGTLVTSEEWLRKPGTVGRPSAGVVIEIVDEDGNVCGPNEEGLVYLSQALWRFEYHNDPDKTEANRRGDMFTVGDIGYLDEEGYLFLCDRQADIIVSGGVNIYPAEVETTLLTHPAVADVAVVGAPSDEWGEVVTAVVELRPGAHATDDELIEYTRGRLAHYKCPRAVDFVGSLGRDPNGKVRKQPIRARYWEGRDRRI
jgi:long-chain acyl-CoA synthetase